MAQPLKNYRINKSYRDVSLRNDIYKNNTSFAESINCSTPLKSCATDHSTPIEERFCTLRENIESTVAALKAQLLEQTEIIAESKQEVCKLARENLHLKSRLAELEALVCPKDKLTISVNSNNTLVDKSQLAAPSKNINSTENIDIINSTLEDKSQLATPSKYINSKDGPQLSAL